MKFIIVLILAVIIQCEYSFKIQKFKASLKYELSHFQTAGKGMALHKRELKSDLLTKATLLEEWIIDVIRRLTCNGKEETANQFRADMKELKILVNALKASDVRTEIDRIGTELQAFEEREAQELRNYVREKCKNQY
jgi:hypothetical protein